jgi:hypothetical protein
MTWKFLDWRTKLYIELTRIYEEMGAIVSAKKTTNRGLS